ncbi:hypothetical protein DBV05_g12188 [Lasiodiplodia theobromae]|uniref:Amidoligase enzyme n=1 Tax=Lasiodiplodia theobromae TaxID=45133 RepID=A0A5N5CUW0_9PEZI|nr:hypothetical protein DBV05_g12188 [Lasiodiplodia theobromae]
MEQVSANASSQAIPDLTFGIELEFILIGDGQEMNQQLYGSGAPAFDALFHSKGRQLVHRVLSNHGVEAVVNGFTPRDNIGGPMSERYQKWTVAPEPTVRLSNDEQLLLPEGFIAEAIELKSPIFSLQDQDYWRGEINHVLDTLQNNFNSEQGLCPSIRLLVNETCAFHVHVGKSDDASRIFTLRTIGNLYQLATGFERVIDELHSADRIKESTWAEPTVDMVDQNGYIKIPLFTPPSSGWKRDADPDVSEEGTPLTWCKVIEDLTAGSNDPNHVVTLNRALQRLTGGSRLVAYNLNNCIVPDLWPLPAYRGTNVGASGSATHYHPHDPQRASNTWTIEFKQHGGTLDVRTVFAWVDVVTAMTGLAEHCADGGFLEREELHDLLQEHAEDASFGPAEFLKDVLKVSVDTQDYYAWVWERTWNNIDPAPAASNTYPARMLLRHNAVQMADLRSRAAVVIELDYKLRSKQYGMFNSETKSTMKDSMKVKLRAAGVV